MQVHTLPLEKTQAFSPLFLDYVAEKEELSPFYGYYPRIENFEKQLRLRQEQPRAHQPPHREVLVEVLKEQYQDIEDAPIPIIDRLKDPKTFTVTTGHQLSLLSGPLYFIYKIITTIRLSQELQEAYPDYQFVPIYWMASEDHDFEEINHFHLFNQTYTWGSDQKGAVGRFSTQGIAALVQEIGEEIPIFEKSYQEGRSLSQATRLMVHQLFGEHVVCLDADDARLKALFSSVIKSDLTEHLARQEVQEASQALEEMDYKDQVFPREINLFYLEGDTRERIVKEGGHYEVLNTDLKFSPDELEKLIADHPERFSPNVVLRPLYQEYILPNLAYIGGPGEIAYWLQLKGVFEVYEQPFPLLIPRNFALVLSKTNAGKYEKLDLSPEELFLEEHALREKYVLRNAEQEIDLSQAHQDLGKVYGEIQALVQQVDATLEGFVGAELNKAHKSLQNIEKRLQKAEEAKQKTALKQLNNLKEKLFPEGKLQERYDNVLNFLINDPAFLSKLFEAFAPLRFHMHVLIDED